VGAYPARGRAAAPSALACLTVGADLTRSAPRLLRHQFASRPRHCLVSLHTHEENAERSSIASKKTRAQIKRLEKIFKSLGRKPEADESADARRVGEGRYRHRRHHIVEYNVYPAFQECLQCQEQTIQNHPARPAATVVQRNRRRHPERSTRRPTCRLQRL
jgi:hypothetical protein